MTKQQTPASAETLHQWDTIEAARVAKKIKKTELSEAIDRHGSYYYQAEKFKWAIPLEALSVWAKMLDINPSQLFLEGEENPRAKIIALIAGADDSKLPQALRVLEAVLAS